MIFDEIDAGICVQRIFVYRKVIYVKHDRDWDTIPDDVSVLIDDVQYVALDWIRETIPGAVTTCDNIERWAVPLIETFVRRN